MAVAPEQVVHVVDDDAAVRQSLELLLKSMGLRVSAYSSGADFLSAWPEDPPGCMVLDIRMPGMSGLELQQQLSARHSILPIIFITGHGDVPMAVEAMQAGAMDFIQKPFRDQDLLDRIAQALGKDAATRRLLGERNAIRARLKSLTPRETEVLSLVVAGKANKVIAGDLDLRQRTVEIHRARVMEKMCAHSLAHLSAHGARRRGRGRLIHHCNRVRIYPDWRSAPTRRESVACDEQKQPIARSRAGCRGCRSRKSARRCRSCSSAAAHASSSRRKRRTVAQGSGRTASRLPDRRPGIAGISGMSCCAGCVRRAPAARDPARAGPGRADGRRGDACGCSRFHVEALYKRDGLEASAGCCTIRARCGP